MPHIFNNGNQIRFSEEPNSHCGVGYIVAEWVSNPTYSSLKFFYGYGKDWPTTIIILPLKTKKVEAVRKQLAEIHPEVLLFLHKIKKLVTLLQTPSLQFLSIVK